MKKKIILSIITMILLLSISMCSFAMGNVTNNIRNFVGGAENKIEDVGNQVTTDVREGFNTVENGTENVVNDVRDGMEDTGNTVAGVVTHNDNDGYTASRTSTDQATMGGMMTNTWTWIIVGIVALAIGIGIWTYVRNKNNDDSYIDSDEI